MKTYCILKTVIGFLAVNFYISGTNLAFARWATQNDAQKETNYRICHIYVNKDGTSKSITESESKLLKELAKNEWAHYSVSYNSSTNKYKVLEAKTIVNNECYPVKLEDIEDKPIASSTTAFDQNNELSISYPNLDLNATVFLRAEITTLQCPIPNHYHNLISMGKNDYTKSDITHIISEIPLFVEKNDPSNVIKISKKIKKDNNKTLYLIEIKQKRPFIHAIINEEQTISNPQHTSYVSISSTKNWTDFGKFYSIEYEKVKQQPLPTLYQEIADIARTKSTPIEKIDIITSMLSQKVTYLSNLRTIKGGLIPQPLQKVADTHLGDCKDFSMATSAILQAIGISSKLALVRRGETNIAPNFILANNMFNHVIVKVELPNEVLWVDPTNFHSMLNPVFPDIANKPALVLDINNPHLEQIPNIISEKNVFKIQETWSMKNPEAVKIKGNLKLTGICAKDFTGLQKKMSNESIKHKLVEELNVSYGSVLDKNITLPNLQSTIVEDLSFDYTLQSRNFGLKTNAGIAMPLLFKYIECFQTKKENVSDVYLGAPHTVDVVSIIEDIKPSDTKSLDCDIKSPWADFTRTVQYEPNRIIIHQIMNLKKSWIEGSELQSKTYKKFQLALNQYFNNGIGIVFEPIVLEKNPL